VLLGLAFFNNVILDIKFPMVIYKKLLSVPVTLEDMQEIDQELYNNFKYIINTKEKGLKDKLCTTFIATADHFGEKITTPLKVYIPNFRKMVRISSLMNITKKSMSVYISIGTLTSRLKISSDLLNQDSIEYVMINSSM
jgi:hypothetical protein